MRRAGALRVSQGNMAENSFDIVCKIDMQEVTNALDQARREIETRYDLKGTKNEVALEKTDINLSAMDDMKLKAVVDIVQSKLHKRGVPLKALTYGKVETGTGGILRHGLARAQRTQHARGAGRYGHPAQYLTAIQVLLVHRVIPRRINVFVQGSVPSHA